MTNIFTRTVKSNEDRSLGGNNVLAVVNQGPVRYFCKRKFAAMSLFESIEVLKQRRRK
jgi:hypothetical protein